MEAPSLDTTIADAPPMVKVVGLLRLVPVMVTSVPTAPLSGLNAVMVGACEKDEKQIVMKGKSMLSFFMGHVLISINIEGIFYAIIK